jgi:hypothetical protein
LTYAGACFATASTGLGVLDGEAGFVTVANLTGVVGLLSFWVLSFLSDSGAFSSFLSATLLSLCLSAFF